MKIDEANERVLVRQSWLGDVLLCPERARLAVVAPEFRSPTDATIIGTSLHHGIEQVLVGVVADYEGMRSSVHEHYALLAAQPHKQTNVDAEHIPTYLDSMSKAFYEEILPQVQLGGKVEHKFAVPLGNVTSNGRYAIWVEGTMDYLDPSGRVWDWKTANRKYNAKEKQSTAIQATVYSAAAVYDGHSDWPVDFRYGVLQRTLTPTSQVVYLRRERRHKAWLAHMASGVVSTALAAGFSDPWFMNDTSNLCSPRWCSYWSSCKGAFYRDEDLVAPDGPVLPDDTVSV